jgi:uncharacterized protein with von Willebrand factor type A (vWA) domain
VVQEVLAADEGLVAFARVLRQAGMAVTADRTQAFLRATALAGAGDRRGVYWSGRATLCASPDDLDCYDKAFEIWFSDEDLPRRRRTDAPPVTVAQAALTAQPGSEQAQRDDRPLAAIASGDEVLRHRDIAQLSPAERRRLEALFGDLRVRPPRRRSLRRGPHRHGEIDPRRTLRDQHGRAGEPGPLRRRRRQTRPRRVVLLLDVSGSMEPYADSHLRLAHRMLRVAPRGVEVFTIGTRLTRVTPALSLRDPDAALRAAGASIPDWSGGTRLGEVLRAFCLRWGQRGLARGAIVVIASDGWERGDPGLLGEQVARLHRLAHAVVWVNPHRGQEGYRPVQGGIAAALPHVDRLVAGHSMASFAELLEVVAHA